MVGRVRSKGSGVANTHTLGQWVPGGSSPSYSNPNRSVCYDRTNPGPPYKSGGSLLISEVSLTFTPSSFATCDNSLWGRYHGAFIHSGVPANGWWGGSPPPAYGETDWGQHSGGAWITSNTGSLEAQGATGWNRAKPGKPIMDLGTFLGELRNVPSLPGRASNGGGGLLNYLRGEPAKARNRVSGAKQVGNEYLNAEFGWSPIIRDLARMLSLREELDRRMAQLRRDNGKPVRRAVTLVSHDESAVTSSSVENPFYPYLHPFYHVNGSGKNFTVVNQYRKDWFEAKFRYFIPDIGMSNYTGPSAAQLLGLNPSPSLVWELLPWSWLIDYFSNVGDVLSNMSDNAAENLVADYAYVMSKVSHTTTAHQSGRIDTKSGMGVVSLHTSAVYKRSLKRRSFASPFGFGVKPGDLSGSQAAILSALGLSRHW